MRFAILFLAPLLACGVVVADVLEDALVAGDLGRAEAELESIVADWEAAYQADPSDANALESGRALHALGAIERQAGKAQEALEHLRLAVERLRNEDAAARADVREALALALQDTGEAVEAEKLLREVMALRPGGPEHLLGMDHLALNLLLQGKLPEAGELLRQSLAATPAADVESRARRQGHLARYFHHLGSHARAAELLRQALAEAGLPEELRLALSSQLALADLRLGRTEEAQQGIENAAQTAVRLYADRPFLAAPYLNNLGALDLSLDRLAEARESFKGSVELLEESFGPDHPALITPLNNLGAVEQADGRLTEAETALRRAAALQAEHLPRVHLLAAETARNLARNALLAGSPAAAAEIDRATALGLEVLEDLIVRGSENERLNFLQRHDLVSLPCATGDGERIAAALIATKSRLFDAMIATTGRRSGPLPHWRDIQRTLPAGSALVDACRFTDLDGVARYGAVVLAADGPPRWVTLGSDEELRRWLGALRARLDWRGRQLAGKDSPAPALKLRGILRALHRQFWEPVARELPPGTDHVAYSPDAALHFLPLAALLDERMQPLCAAHAQVAVVASARDLAGAPAATPLAGAPWELLGISEFPKSAADPAGDPLLELLASLHDMPGTADEVKRLADIAPEGSVVKRDAEVTERGLMALSPAPAVLHLGCHAFYLPDPAAMAGALDLDDRADRLFAGGLLLHRAAQRTTETPRLTPDDDLLFPAEVATLPLQGTRLVTLSSCESGAGTAVSGEGVLGLRRGFALAGAREVVVALWPVSDRMTPAFMERFYRLALASDRPAQALWQCQREFLTAAADDDAFETAVLRYAPFVLSQNTPLATGETIVAAASDTPFPWRWALPAAALALYLSARFGLRRRTGREVTG
jgi:CHAT domain-containing protein/tetratricopeptide (TPR) repeat protein